MHHQTLYVSSDLRSQGDPSRFLVSVGNGVLRARKGYTTHCAVIEATINRSWYNVQEGLNYISLFSGAIIRFVPPGQHDVNSLRAAMQTILGTYDIEVSYSRLTGKYTLTGSNTSPSIDLGPMGPALGWPQDSVVVFPENTNYVVSSPLPARISSVTAIYIHSDLSKQGDSVVDNLYGDDFYGSSTIICKVPVNVAPFDNQVFTSSSIENDLFELQDGLVDSIWFWVTDESGKPLDLFFDWSMTILVRHTPKDNTDMIDILEETRDLVKLAVLSNENILP